MNKQKFNFFAVLGLLFPVLYHLCSRRYTRFLSFMRIGNIPSLKEFLINNPKTLDAIYCLILIIICYPIYKYIKNYFELKINRKTPMSPMKNLMLALVFSLGFSGLIMGVQLGTRNVSCFKPSRRIIRRILKIRYNLYIIFL